MKTKITLMIAFVSLSFTSCVKDYIGHGNDKIKLTAENNIYEGDLYTIFLNAEIEIVDEKIKNFGKSGKNKNESLEDLQQKRASLKQELGSNLVPDFLFRRIPRPKPPCPSPQNCNLFGFDFITSLNESKLKSITILDANGGEIGGSTGNQNTLSRTRGRVIVDDFKISDYSGAATIEVVTEGENRLTDNYSINTFIN